MSRINLEPMKKHAAIPAAIVALCALLSLTFWTYGMKDNGSFELRSLAGSREALSGVEIGGELIDGYHRTAFLIADGRIGTRTTVFEQPHWNWNDFYRYVPGGMKKTADGMQYSVEDRRASYSIIASKPKDDYMLPFGTAELNPPIAYHGTETDPNAVTMANSAEYGLAKIGDHVYYTPPVSSYFTGTSGIYELKFHAWPFGFGENKADYAPRRVADLPLDANGKGTGKEKGSGGGIEVLGMEAVGGHLALLSVKNHALVVQSYDPESGTLLGEATVPDFYLPGRPDNPADASAYSEPYEVHPNGDDSLILSFRRSAANAPSKPAATVFVVDFAGGAKIAQRFELSLDDSEKEAAGALSDMRYLNGKLYVVRSWRERPIEPGTDPKQVIRDVRNQNHLQVYVFEPSKLLYKGELITDMNEDLIRTVNARDRQAGYPYREADARTFANITIQADNPGTGDK